MSKADGVFIYIGTYASEVDARADYDLVKDLHSQGAVGTYDAAVSPRTTTGRSTSTRTRRRHGMAPGAGPARGRSSASCSRRPSSARPSSALPSEG